MAELRLEETKIPEDVSKELATKQLGVASMHVGKIVKVMMTGTSKLLGSLKEISTPKAIAFRRPDGRFLAGAKVEFHSNPAEPDTPASGNWSYIWTFNEEDLADAKIITIGTNAESWQFFESAASKLYNMSFESESSGVMLINTLLEHISKWLDDNAKDAEVQRLVCPGCLIAECAVENGSVVKSIVPDGEMKVLIKGDDDYQDSIE